MQLICEDLRQNKCVVLPTETVYGLAANAQSDEAVANVYALKNRPHVNPLILHGASVAMLSRYAEFTDMARLLAKHFWPGSLTMILKAKEGVSTLARAGLDTVGVRVPNHPAFHDVLDAFGKPLVAPSANPSNYLSATTAHDVLRGFSLRSELHGSALPSPQSILNILDGGACSQGIESTILDLTTPVLRILRAGALSREEIEAIAPTDTNALTVTTASPTAPGQLKTHYAPRFRLRLDADCPHPGEAWIGFGADNFRESVAHGFMYANLSPKGCLIEAARNLFNVLHRLDHVCHANPGAFSQCAVAKIPQIGLGLGINDRLTRAAAVA